MWLTLYTILLFGISIDCFTVKHSVDQSSFELIKALTFLHLTTCIILKFCQNDLLETFAATTLKHPEH